MIFISIDNIESFYSSNRTLSQARYGNTDAVGLKKLSDLKNHLNNDNVDLLIKYISNLLEFYASLCADRN